MTVCGRAEARRTVQVGYRLLASCATRRMACLNAYAENLKDDKSLASGEASRIHQYERYVSLSIECLERTKMYRSPQALRSFARVFTMLMPPFYASTFAQVGYDLRSVGMGIAFGIITALGLCALFESMEVLEDPFVAYVSLDGINVREELEVMNYAQLVNARKLIFPDAPPFPVGSRAALTGNQGLVAEILNRKKKKKKKDKAVSDTAVPASSDVLKEEVVAGSDTAPASSDASKTDVVAGSDTAPASADVSEDVVTDSDTAPAEPEHIVGTPIEGEHHGVDRRVSAFRDTPDRIRHPINR